MPKLSYIQNFYCLDKVSEYSKYFFALLLKRYDFLCKAHTEVPQFNTFQAKLVNTSRGETRILKNKLDRNPRGGKNQV